MGNLQTGSLLIIGTGQGEIQGPPIFNFCLNLVDNLDRELQFS